MAPRLLPRERLRRRIYPRELRERLPAAIPRRVPTPSAAAALHPAKSSHSATALWRWPAEEEWASMVAGRRVERAENVEGTLPLNFAFELFTNTSAIRHDLGYKERVPRIEAVAKTVAWESALKTT